MRIRLRACAGPGADEGSAAVEFIGWTVVIVVPVLYLIVALAQVQAASFAVSSAADAAARVLEVEEGEGAADHARTAVGLALSDQRLDADPVSAMTMTCSEAGCARAVVRVEAGVDLPLLGSVGVGRGVIVLDAERAVKPAGAGRAP